MRLRRIDHVGVVVEDLPAVTAFFLDLGLTVLGQADLEGSFLDTVVGLTGAKTSSVWLQLPDGGATIEVVAFHAPPDRHPSVVPDANTRGLNHLAFAVDDIDAIVDRLRARGHTAFSPVQTYAATYRLCLIRGPENLIIELAEPIA